MLANTSNVMIQPCRALDMDQLHLALLSKTRHHLQLEEFQAASQQVPKNKPKRLRSPEPLPLLLEGSEDLMDGLEEEDGDDGSFRVPAPPKNKKGRKKK